MNEDPREAARRAHEEHAARMDAVRDAAQSQTAPADKREELKRLADEEHVAARDAARDQARSWLDSRKDNSPWAVRGRTGNPYPRSDTRPKGRRGPEAQPGGTLHEKHPGRRDHRKNR